MQKYLYFGIAVLCLMTSCQSNKEVLRGTDRSFIDAMFSPNHYAETFDSFTLEERVHSEFDPILTAYATHWNQTLQEAYTKEMAEQYRLSDEAEKNLAQEQLLEGETFFIFILSVSTREPEWNDLDKKNSIWRVTLESRDGSIQLDPERIESISQKDEKAKYFYRKMSSFNRTYRVRFDRATWKNGSPMYLHIAGARGAIAFKFDPDQGAVKP